MTDHELSRRRVLRGVAAGAAITGTAGEALADRSRRTIVGLEPGADHAVARRRADSVRREMDFGRIGKAVAGRFPEQALRGLENNPNVRYIENDTTYRALAQSVPWGIDRVDADILHDNGETGDGADIAIIDTGIDSDHEDLQSNLGAGKAYVSCSSGCNYAWDDDNGHGTHCAGTADAVDNSTGVVGVATQSTLHAVKVLDSNGGGSLSDIASAIEYVADQGWDVASMSLGASSGDQTLKDACQYAYNNGVLLVAAAGNDGPCSECVGYPAAYSEVIAVSSTASDDSLSSFSSTGSEVELAAPGSDVNSTWNDGGYNTISGTSMACPHVSGAGGQLMANGYTNTEARQRLQDTAEDIGLSSNEQGYGLLDAENAVLGSGGGGGGDSDCVDATVWPDGSGYSGYEYLTSVDLDGQVVESSSDNAYYDFTCPDVVTVQQGGSFQISIDFEDAGYDGHYANVYVDWDGNGDWSTATETQLFADVSDDTVTYTGTVDVPSDAATGGTLARVRLSYGGFDGPSATGEYGEVNDFTVFVESSESAPAVDSLSASEVETSDGDAEFDVTWDVSDADGNLSGVDLTLTDDTAGETEDTASVSVSGSSASGTTRLVAASDDGSGNSYTVDATVTDGQGNTGTGSTTVGETETTCVDATVWPDGSGYSGYEYLTTVDMDGQVAESSSDNAYYDFTCPDVVTVQQGGSFQVSIDFEDAGYDGHYANVYVDWDRNGDWSTATEYRVFGNVSDDTVTYTGTFDVPSDAATGGTLARVRLSYGGYDGPSATGEYGEVNDFTIYVE